jgi:hypothetical protein
MEIKENTTYIDEVRNFVPGMDLPGIFKISDGPKGLSTFYAPFEYTNHEAKLVICGITPGLKQASTALQAMRGALENGSSQSDALRIAKNTGSFAGAMRRNIVSMLDHIEVNKVLGIETCEYLFDSRSDLVNYTSALRFPVFKNGENYSGGKEMINEPYLWNQIEEYLKEEVDLLQEAIWLPLGQSVVAVFEKFVENGWIKSDRVLFGLPHASGANAERIAYFLGNKPKEKLSKKTNAEKIDFAKLKLLDQVQGLL